MTKLTLTLMAALMTSALAGTAGNALAQDWHGSRQWHSRGDWSDHDRDDRNDRWERNNGHDNGWHKGREAHRIYYAPRRGAAVRNYVYYPQARAYYAPWNHRWYYRHHNRWVVAAAAPININLGNGISISLGADSPVTYDSYVVREYQTYYR